MNKPKVLITMVLVASLASFILVFPSAAAGPQEAPDLQIALKIGAKTKSWILLVMFDPTVIGQDCTKTILLDPKVRAALSKFVVVKLVASTAYAGSLKKVYGLCSAGTLILFRPDGAVQAVDNGTPPNADAFIADLNQLIAGHNVGARLRK